MTISVQPHLHRLWIIARGFVLLTSIYFLGNWLAGFLPFPMPGAVLGMVIVFLLLQMRLLPLAWVDLTSVWLLAFLGLFYVPYGVGIVQSGDLIAQWGGHMVVVILITVLAVFYVSARAFSSISRLTEERDE